MQQIIPAHKQIAVDGLFDRSDEPIDLLDRAMALARWPTVKFLSDSYIWAINAGSNFPKCAEVKFPRRAASR
jgi:hypothetical protein